MNTGFTAIIADDEPLLRHHLDKSLAEVWPELDIVAKVADGEQALLAIEQSQPDIAFLDIRMPVLDGMSLAQKLNRLANPPLIVFVTAYDDYAIKAFEQNAADYLLKPISDARLQTTCERVKARLSQRGSDNSHVQMNSLLENNCNSCLRLKHRNTYSGLKPRKVTIFILSRRLMCCISKRKKNTFRCMRSKGRGKCKNI